MAESPAIRITHAEPPKAFFRLANPIMKAILASPLHGLLDDDLMLLRWRGRKTGATYTTPVGYKQDGNTLTVFTFSGWKANFRQPHPVDVKLKGQWRSGTGIMDDDPRRSAEFVLSAVAGGDRGAYRRFQMQVEGDRTPTVEELIPEVQKRKMALVTITLGA